MAISTPGIGSNLDVKSIVSQLMAVEQQPLKLLARKEASFQAKLSGFGTLKGALSQFQTAVRGLSDISKFQGVRATSADATIATASATATAIPGTYALEVTKLAQAQKLATAGQASVSTVVGNGTLTFDIGTIAGGTLDTVTGKYTGASFTTNGSGVKTVTIDATNNSLSGIRDAINSAKIGVSATIVNDGGTSPHRLVLTEASSGKANSVKVSVTGDAALSTLLAHNPAAAPAGQALMQTVTAQNAEFKLDGIAVSVATNTISDVIAGVTLNLAKTNSGSTTNISVSRDTASVSSAVNSFVKSYNDISKTLKDAAAYNAATKQGTILNGEAAVRTIEIQLRGVLSAPVAGGASAFSLLSHIGVTLQKDGSLAVDGAKLQAALDSNFSEFAGLFAAAGKIKDSLIAYSGATSKTASGAYDVNVTQLATQGNVVGAGLAGLAITTGTNDALLVQLDGLSATVTLAPATYASAAALAAEVQSKINSAAGFVAAGSTVTVTESAGVLKITSNRYGSSSAVSISGGTGQANLAFNGGGVITVGLDTVGSINGVAATSSGQSLTSPAGNASEGISIKITGGSIGARGTVNYSQGYAYQFEKLASTLLGTEGSLSSRTKGLDQSIKDIGGQRAVLERRMVEIEIRYRAQFTALDLSISSMTKTSSFLTQQLAIISNNTLR